MLNGKRVGLWVSGVALAVAVPLGIAQSADADGGHHGFGFFGHGNGPTRPSSTGTPTGTRTPETSEPTWTHPSKTATPTRTPPTWTRTSETSEPTETNEPTRTHPSTAEPAVADGRAQPRACPKPLGNRWIGCELGGPRGLRRGIPCPAPARPGWPGLRPPSCRPTAKLRPTRCVPRRAPEREPDSRWCSAAG